MGKYLLFHRHHVVKLLLWIGMEGGDIHYVIECASCCSQCCFLCQNILLSSDDELVRTGLITLCDKHLEWTDFHNSDKRCCSRFSSASVGPKSR